MFDFISSFPVLSSSGSKKKRAHGSISSNCGANFCYPPRHSDHAELVGWNFSASSPSSNRYYQSADATNDVHRPANISILMLLLLAMSFVGTLILIFFVDTIPSAPKLCAKGGNDNSSRKMLIATFRQLKNPNQILLIPMTLWTGFEHAFRTADFTYVRFKKPNK